MCKNDVPVILPVVSEVHRHPLLEEGSVTLALDSPVVLGWPIWDYHTDLFEDESDGTQAGLPFWGVDFEDLGELDVSARGFPATDSASCVVNSEEYLESPDGQILHPLVAVGQPVTPDAELD
jgi:hypothetical protein